MYSVSAKPLLLNLDLINILKQFRPVTKIRNWNYFLFRSFYNKFIYAFKQPKNVFCVRNVRNFSKSGIFCIFFCNPGSSMKFKGHRMQPCWEASYRLLGGGSGWALSLICLYWVTLLNDK